MAGTGGAGKSAASAAGGKAGLRPVIIRREEVSESGHHGGAWKVAYADFVTAMMAFFLLMWLINATTEDQRRGIAAYFSPMATVENGYSGSGMIPGGAVPVADAAQLLDQGPAKLATLLSHGDTTKSDSDGDPDSGSPDSPTDPSMVAPTSDPIPSHSPKSPDGSVQTPPDQAGAAAAENAAARARQEDRELRKAAGQLRDAVTRTPALAGIGGQVSIDVTPDGMRIQIMDAQRQSMFASGSVVPNARAKILLGLAAHYLARLPEAVSVEGYTDAAPYPQGPFSNWALSSGRADAARDILNSAGLADARLSSVTGYADRKLLLPADPLSPANRRIVLTLHRDWPLPAAVR